MNQLYAHVSDKPHSHHGIDDGHHLGWGDAFLNLTFVILLGALALILYRQLMQRPRK